MISLKIAQIFLAGGTGATTARVVLIAWQARIAQRGRGVPPVDA